MRLPVEVLLPLTDCARLVDDDVPMPRLLVVAVLSVLLPELTPWDSVL